MSDPCDSGHTHAHAASRQKQIVPSLNRRFVGVSTTFDHPNLVSAGGLVPVVALAHDCRLGESVADKLTRKTRGGVDAHPKVPGLVAGMVAGADSIDDMDLLRHGGMDRLLAGIRAPSMLGTSLRALSVGHVRRLESVAAAFLTGLARRTPLMQGAGRSPTWIWTTPSARRSQLRPRRRPAAHRGAARTEIGLGARAPHPCPCPCDHRRDAGPGAAHPPNALTSAPSAASILRRSSPRSRSFVRWGAPP